MEQQMLDMATGNFNTGLFRGSLSQAVPEGEHSQDDGGQTGQHEQEVTQLEQLARYAGPLGIGQNATSVEEGLSQIVNNQQYQREPGEPEHVGGGDEDQVEGCVLDLR